MDNPSSKNNGLRDWAVKHAEGPYGKFWLGVISFAESSFFPIPPDVLLIAIVSLRKGFNWFYYSAITTVFSVLGGIFGYLIGYLFYDTFGKTIISYYHLESEVSYIGKVFADNAFSAIFLAGFTPIPYKIFTISAGLFGINLLTFVAASIVSRGARFVAVGYISKVFGAKMSDFVFKYFNLLTAVLAVLIILLLFAVNYLG